MKLQIIFWSSNPSALHIFTLSINLAWMDDKYKDVESKYESRDIWRISKRHLNNIWNPALLQHLLNFLYCLNLLNYVKRSTNKKYKNIWHPSECKLNYCKAQHLVCNVKGLKKEEMSLHSLQSLCDTPKYFIDNILYFYDSSMCFSALFLYKCF